MKKIIQTHTHTHAKPSQTVSRICFVYCVAADIALCCYYFLSLARIPFPSSPRKFQKGIWKMRILVCSLSLLFGSSSNSVIFVLLGGYMLSFAVDNSLWPQQNGRTLGIFELIFRWFSNEQLSIRLWNRLMMGRKPVRHWGFFFKYFGCARTKAS